MTILSQNGKCIVNYNNVVAIQSHGKYVQAHSVTGDAIPIGLYENEDRADDVVDDIAITIDRFSDDVIYVMPEE